MPVPVGLSFSVNLNELFKDLTSKFEDAYDRGEDLQALEDECRREMKRSQDLRTILASEQIVAKTVFAEMTADQREQILALANEAEELWQQFNRLLDQYRSNTSLPSNIKRSVVWSARGKRKSGLILARIKNVNQYVKDEIDTFIEWFTKHNVSPERVLQLQQKIDAEVAGGDGLAQSISLRRTWRETMQWDTNILKTAKAINPKKGAGSALYKTVYGRALNTLVEHRGYNVHDERVEYDALQLATFLNMKKPDTMRAPTCLAVFHDASDNSYGFVYDLTPLDSAPNAQNNHKTPLEKAVPTLTNLRSELSKGTNPLFRYSRFGNDPSYAVSRPRYLGWDERIIFASSLARTLYEVLLVDWVHQDIRSDNIWFTLGEETVMAGGDPDLNMKRRIPNRPYLFNFQLARPSEAYSNDNLAILSNRSLKSLNLSRHPARQFGNLLVPHGKIHDIYALGIVLLEIGLGRPIDELCQVFDTIILQNPEVGVGLIVSKRVDPGAEARRRRLVVGAATLLPERMGNRFATVVVQCLTGTFQSQDSTTVEDVDIDVSILRQFRHNVVEELLQLTENSAIASQYAV